VVDTVRDWLDRGGNRIGLEVAFRLFTGTQHQVGLIVKPAKIPPEEGSEGVSATKAAPKVLSSDVGVDHEWAACADGVSGHGNRPRPDRIAVGDIVRSDGAFAIDYPPPRTPSQATGPRTRLHRYPVLEQFECAPLVSRRRADPASLQRAFEFEIVEHAHGSFVQRANPGKGVSMLENTGHPVSGSPATTIALRPPR